MPDIYTTLIILFGSVISVLMIVVIVAGFKQYIRSLKEEDEAINKVSDERPQDNSE